MNNPKTIEAIKVLYRGDIDDAPNGTDLLRIGKFVVCKHVQGGSHFVTAKDGGMCYIGGWMYTIVRALCLQEETTSDEHPLHAELIEELEALIEKVSQWGKNHSNAWVARETREALRAIIDVHAPPAPVKEPEVEWQARRMSVDEFVNYDGEGMRMFWARQAKRFCHQNPAECDGHDCEHVQAVHNANDPTGTFYLVTRKQQGAH